MSIRKQTGSDWSREKENGDNDKCNKCGCVMQQQDQNHDGVQKQQREREWRQQQMQHMWLCDAQTGSEQ